MILVIIFKEMSCLNKVSDCFVWLNAFSHQEYFYLLDIFRYVAAASVFQKKTCWKKIIRTCFPGSYEQLVQFL